MPKNPKASQQLRRMVHDQPSLNEVLADGLIGAAYMEGLIVLTFSVERVLPGVEGPNAPRYRAVVSRLALTKTAFRDLAATIPRLQSAINLDEHKPTSGQQPN
jgi:hypothetical protein